MPRGTEAKQFQITCAVAVKMAAMAAMAEMAVKAEKAEKAMSDDLRDSSESFVEICSRKGIETHERHRQEKKIYIYLYIHV